MKLFICILTLGILFSTNTYAQHQDIDSSEDEVKTKDAVVNWADSVFYKHSEYKFEHFKALYTEEYFISVMRSRMYKERLDHLEQDKKLDHYKKSDAEYEKEHKELEDAYLKIQKEADNFSDRVTHFRIHFWSNIQTNDGITVYYEHIIKLDNNYQVMDAQINSSIGKKSDKTEILFKKDVKGEKKK